MWYRSDTSFLNEMYVRSVSLSLSSLCLVVYDRAQRRAIGVQSLLFVCV